MRILSPERGDLARASKGQTFVVVPSGDDDTAHIQAAFNASVAAGPGSTVRFAAGHFYTNGVAVQGFNGSVIGAGRGKTVIDSLRGLNPARDGVGLTQFDPNDPTTLFPVPVLFGFDGGSVSMSNLTFDITAAEPAETWFLIDLAWTDLRVVVLVTGDTSSRFDRVEFVGHAGSSWGVNNVHAILVGGMRQLDNPGGIWSVIQPTRGHHSITRCWFKGVGDAIGVQHLTGGKLRVGQTASRGNVFDTPIGAFSPSDNPDSDLEFSYNEVHTYHAGVSVIDYDAGASGPIPARPGHYVISHNSIDVLDAGDWDNGVVLADYGRAPGSAATFTALVADNTITIDGRKARGIFGDNARDVEVLNNRIFGSGFAGIVAGVRPPEPDCDEVIGWLIRDNGLKHLIATKAPIWLGPNTRRCRVVGPNVTTTVLDEGIGNILTDTSLGSPPPGPLPPWPWKPGSRP